MRFLAGAAFVLLAVGRILSQEDNGQGPAANPAPDAVGTVRGQAMFEDTAGPVRHARVLLLSATQGAMTSVGMTDARGAFLVQKVKPGTYFIAVDAPGCVSPFSLLRTKDIMQGKPDLSALDGEVTQVTVDPDHEAAVDLKVRRGASISGHVIYDDETPAADVSISLLRKDDPDAGRVVTGFESAFMLGQKTDDRGIYRIAGLPPGDYLVRASEPAAQGTTEENLRNSLAAGGSLTPVFFDKASTIEDATPVHLDAGVEAENIDIRLPAYTLRVVSGTVVAQSDGHPLQNARIQIRPKQTGKDAGGLLTTTSDDQGAWVFGEVPDGGYLVTVEPHVDVRYDLAAKDAVSQAPGNFAAKTLDITVKDNDLTGLRIELQDDGKQNGEELNSSAQGSGSQGPGNQTAGNPSQDKPDQ